MGKKITGTDLASLLSGATNIGILEDPVNLGGLPVVFRNLRPAEHQAISAEVQEEPEENYLEALMLSTISRALVEINGNSLRDISVVSVPDPKDPKREIGVELHAFLRSQVVATWSRETLAVAYRKVLDIFAQAEEKSKQGVTFYIPDETDDEKLRRLLTEAKETMGSLPVSLVEGILTEYGFRLGVGLDEVRDVDVRLKAIDQPKEEPKVQVPTGAPVYASIPQSPPEDEERMPPVAVSPVRQQPPPVPAPSSRYAEIQAAESSLGLEVPESQVDTGSSGASEVKPVLRVKPKEVLIDAGPQGGINPMFRPRRA